MLVLVIACLFVSSSLAADSGCVSPNISLDEKLRLNADANDHDQNGVTTTADVLYDLRNNYDKNDDGVVNEAEWIARWTCAFGDTPYMARFAFNLINQGRADIQISAFSSPVLDQGIPRAQFIAVNRQRYELFKQDGCVNRDLTIDQKLAINLRHNNHNNDSVVDSSDIAFDLNNNYDTNNDTKVTEAEWIIRWTCAYGDTSAYARFVWNQLAQGADFITTSAFNVPPFDTGIPLAQFEEMNRKRYQVYAEQQGPTVGKK